MRILLADDQMQVRSALRLSLEQEPGVCVVGEAAHAEELLTQTKATRPDLVLLDWELPNMSGTGPSPNTEQGMLEALRNLNPSLMVVALSSRPEACQLALAAGAEAFVSKGDAPEPLLSTVRAMLRKSRPTWNE